MNPHLKKWAEVIGPWDHLIYIGKNITMADVKEWVNNREPIQGQDARAE